MITNNTLLHVSTFKMSSSGSSFCLAKITYRFSGVSKIKLLKYIYILINDCTIISNTIITNNTLLHVSTFKMSSSGSSFCLVKITYRFSASQRRREISRNLFYFVQSSIKFWNFVFKLLSIVLSVFKITRLSPRGRANNDILHSSLTIGLLSFLEYIQI